MDLVPLLGVEVGDCECCAVGNRRCEDQDRGKEGQSAGSEDIAHGACEDRDGKAEDGSVVAVWGSKGEQY